MNNDNKIEHEIFSLVKKVVNTQEATIQLVETFLGPLSIQEKGKILQLTDVQDGYTPLIWAAKNGLHELIKFFVEPLRNSDSELARKILNQSGGWNESTALIKAAEADHAEAVAVLLSLGVNRNMANKFGSTALMLASEKGHIDVVEALVDSKADMNLQNCMGYTALILAAEQGHTSVVKILCEAGADKSIANQFGKTALIMAAECNNIDCVKALFMVKPENLPNINQPSKKGMTALMLAAVKGHEEPVKELLRRGADTSLKCESDGGLFALTYSFISKNKSIVKQILRKTLLVDDKDKKGRTPFMLAAESGNKKVVRLLLEGLTKRQVEEKVQQRCEEGSTSLHLAAAAGHIEMLVYLMELAHGAIKLKNKNGKSPTDLLAKFYIGNQDKFEDFVNIASKKSELLELLPKLLPTFRSPNGVLNECFVEILLKIRESDEVNFLVNLVHLAVGIKLAITARPLEASDLKERLEVVQIMLRDLMSVNTMDNEQNVLLVVEDKHLRNIYDFPENVHRARALVNGPLALCLKHNFLSIFGTRQISIFVNNVFSTSLRVKKTRPLETFGDIFQMRSNCTNWRTNPAFSFLFEGMCKFVTLCIVTVLCWQQSPFTLKQLDANYNAIVFEKLSATLEAIVVASVLYEFGKLMSSKFKIRRYLNEVWMFVDAVTLALLITWTVMTARLQNKVDYAYISATNNTVTTGTVVDYSIPDPPAKAILAISALLLCLGSMRYITGKGIGHYVLMVMSMVWELRNFLVVILIATAGFAIAFHGLFPFLYDFRTVERTMLQLFYALIGQFDPNLALFEGDPNETVGILLFVCYIVFSNVILINIVIASFAARNLQRFLLISERDAFSMLPAPFNVIPALFAPLHYGYLYYIRQVTLTSERLVGGGGRGSVVSVRKDFVPVALQAESHQPVALDDIFVDVDMNTEKLGSVHGEDMLSRLRNRDQIAGSMSGRPLNENINNSVASPGKGYVSVAPGPVGSSHSTADQAASRGDDDDDDLSLSTCGDDDNDEDMDIFGEDDPEPHDCICSCEQEANDVHHHASHGQRMEKPFLSICGTTSDITLGILLMFPCAFYEIYLCLEEIRKHQKENYLFWMCLVVAILGFPFFYAGFVITLLIETLQLRTLLVIERDNALVYYGKDELLPDATHDAIMDSSKNYLRLFLKVIRLDFIASESFLGSILSRSVNLIVVVTIGKQTLVTHTIQSTEKLVLDSTKDFYLCLDDPSDTQIEVTLYDGHSVLGLHSASIKEWVANERFEGKVLLRSPRGKEIGSIVLTAQRKPISKVVKTAVHITSVIVRMISVKAVDGEMFSSRSQYIVRLTLGGRTVETRHAKPIDGGDVVKYHQFLCVSCTSSHETKPPLKLKIELWERKEHSLAKDRGNYWRLLAETDQCTDESVSGPLEMRNHKCKPVCSIELSAKVTRETAKYLYEGSGQTSQGSTSLPRIRWSKRNQDSKMGVCSTCRRAVRHTCRTLKNKKERLFSEEELDKLFIGVELEQNSVAKSEFSHALRQELRRAQKLHDQRLEDTKKEIVNNVVHRLQSKEVDNKVHILEPEAKEVKKVVHMLQCDTLSL